MGNLKRKLKYSSLTRIPYSFLKNIKDGYKEKQLFKFHGDFINRSRGSSFLVIVLAGYKEYLYKNVFDRIYAYCPNDYDVCIITSGKHSDAVDRICKTNDWSYLYTQENNVSLVQNIAIKLHPEAEYIFKLDEDIFITERYFDKLYNAFIHAQEGEYNPGVLAPLLLVNGYSSNIIINKLGLMDLYKKNFGSLKIAAGPEQTIENNVEAAKFMWGQDWNIFWIIFNIKSL